MLDDERGAAFLQRLEDGVEIAREFGSGNDFEHDAMVDRLFTMVKPDRCWVSLVALLAVAACQPAPTPSPTPSATARVTPTSIAACPATPAVSGSQVLAKNLAAPDDLAFANDGRLLFSDIKAGAVSALNADGSLERIAGGMSE